MKCAWKELLRILPPWLAEEVDRRGRDTLQEIRLRLGQKTELYLGDKSLWINRCASYDDLNFSVNTASRYSPWAAHSISKGYLTASGGHRIGLCGEAVIRNGTMDGIRSLSSLCIRVARDFQGIGESISALSGSILLLGPPGSGKTTLLRDIIRYRAKQHTISVVDERGELFPDGFSRGDRIDVMTGCPKRIGIETVLRTMSPAYIAVDEITATEDCTALEHAAWCGVKLLATAHAANIHDLQRRSVYRSLAKERLFEHILVLKKDKSWTEERMDI